MKPSADSSSESAARPAEAAVTTKTPAAAPVKPAPKLCRKTRRQTRGKTAFMPGRRKSPLRRHVAWLSRGPSFARTLAGRRGRTRHRARTQGRTEISGPVRHQAVRGPARGRGRHAGLPGRRDHHRRQAHRTAGVRSGGLAEQAVVLRPAAGFAGGRRRLEEQDRRQDRHHLFCQLLAPHGRIETQRRPHRLVEPRHPVALARIVFPIPPRHRPDSQSLRLAARTAE